MNALPRPLCASASSGKSSFSPVCGKISAGQLQGTYVCVKAWFEPAERAAAADAFIADLRLRRPSHALLTRPLGYAHDPAPDAKVPFALVYECGETAFIDRLRGPLTTPGFIPMTAATRANVALGAASVLVFLHERGLVHGAMAPRVVG